MSRLSCCRLVAVFALVAALFSPNGAFAQGQSQTRRPVDPGRPADRIKPDSPRLGRNAPLVANTTAPTNDIRIDALLSGYRWPSGTTTITYSFYNNAVFAGSYYGTETVSEVSAGVKTNVRAIMAWYSTMLNINLVEVTETANNIGLIRIMDSTAPGYAYAYYPYSTAMFDEAGDVHLQVTYDFAGSNTNGFQNPAGEHGYVSLIHEIGHALGLKHPHDGTPNLSTADDNHTHTVMSYQFYGESPGTPMGFDIMALQYLYGARGYRTSGDTYLVSNSALDQYTLGGSTFIAGSLRTKQAIWDSGGYNVIDLSSFTADAGGYRLDMAPLGWMSTNANFLTTYLNAGLIVGPGVTIHKLINTGSNDTIYANDAANVFAGYASTRRTGADIIIGATTQDTVDLSGYLPSGVFQSASGNDLVLNLGTNGSITLKDYYLSASNQPVITYGSVTPSVSIANTSVSEGSTTTTANFLVTLSSPAATTQTVNFATSNGSATSGSDFAATSGTVTFLAGETQKSIPVTIFGDTTVESDETFFVTLSSPSAGITLGTVTGTGTILNDDVAPNLSPSVTISATPTSGFAPLPVTFSSAGTADPDGSIASYAWAFGDGSTSTAANPSHTYATTGTFTATLTVTDNQGATASKSITITVSADPAKVLHVGSIVMSKVSTSSGVTAVATVTLLDPNNQPIAGATLSGAWTGLVRSSSTGTSDATGKVVVQSRATKKRGTFTFTISSVTLSGYTFNAAGGPTSGSISVP